MFLEELQWHFYGVVIMLGIFYTDLRDGHVRMDLLARKFSPKVKNAIEALGILCFLFPFLWIVMDHGIEFAYDAFRTGESSPNPGGLSYRWAIKAVIPLAMIPLFLTSIIRLFGTGATHDD